MIIISLILDYLCDYYLFIDASFFISLIITISYFWTSRKNLIFIIFLGIFYDLLFSNVLFLYLICFYLLYYFVSFIKNKISFSYFSYLIILILSFIFMYSVLYFLLLIIDITDIDIYYMFNYIFRKIVSGVLISLIYYFIFRKLKNNINFGY